MNTHILLHMHNSIIINHTHDIVSLIMEQILNLKSFINCTAKVNEEWNTQRACSCITQQNGTRGIFLLQDLCGD